MPLGRRINFLFQLQKGAHYTRLAMAAQAGIFNNPPVR
jgi:hypothetical protein